jgi:hypothetical protein
MSKAGPPLVGLTNRRVRWRQALLMIAVGCAFAAFGWLGITFFPNKTDRVAVFVAKLAAAFFLARPVLTVVHEAGHALTGLAFGAPIDKLRIGGWKRVAIPIGPNFRLVLGLSCYTGRVDFRWLPVSRDKRIAMYLAGVTATIPVAILVCLFPLKGLIAYQAGVMLLVVASALDNLRGRHPDETRNADCWSDGDAVRGLLSHGFGKG